MDVIAYGEYYNQAMQGISEMLFSAGNPMGEFKKDKYAAAFESYCYRFDSVIHAIEAVYQEEENPQAWLEKLTSYLIEEAKKALDAIPKKQKRNDQLLNYNMVLAVYVLPAMLEKKGQFAEPLTDLIVERWNKEFKTTIGKATYEKISSGFNRKLCYITTAVCESQGKPDDCYELETLRNYRDTYLLSSEEGRQMVEEYYNIAPTIVNRMNKCADSAHLYEELRSNYISPCIRLIEAGELEACRETYKNMVYELKGRYMA